MSIPKGYKLYPGLWNGVIEAGPPGDLQIFYNALVAGAYFRLDKSMVLKHAGREFTNPSGMFFRKYKEPMVFEGANVVIFYDGVTSTKNKPVKEITTGAVFLNGSVASLATGIARTNISHALQGRQKRTGKYFFTEPPIEMDYEKDLGFVKINIFHESGFKPWLEEKNERLLDTYFAA